MSTAARRWSVGDELAQQALPPVTRLDLIRYAGASGDYNPIHTIDEEAERAGLPGVIQHGMLTMARIGLLLSAHLEHGYVKRFRTRFSGMVQLGDRITIAGRCSGVEEREEGTLYTFAVSARKPEGRPVASGTVEFLVFGAAPGQG